VAADSEDMVIL